MRMVFKVHGAIFKRVTQDLSKKPRTWKPPETEESKAAKALERAEKAKRKKEKKQAKEETDVKSEEESGEHKFLDMHAVCRHYAILFIFVLISSSCSAMHACKPRAKKAKKTK